MSRVLSHRLAKLETRKAQARGGVVVIPWRDWPADEDEAAWERLKAQHPHGRLFIPSQMTIEEWEQEAGR